MIQRLTDIKTDSTAAFEKESKLLVAVVTNTQMTIALFDKPSGECNAAEIIGFGSEDVQQENFVKDLKQRSALANYAALAAHVFFTTSKSMLIPAKLINNAALFVNTQFGMQEGEKLITDTITNDISSGFVLNTWQQKIAAIFPESKQGTTQNLLVKQAYANTDSNENIAWLNIADRHADLVVIKNKELQLARSFSFVAIEDVLYHVLNSFQQLQMQASETQLILQGAILEGDALFTLLKNYLSHVQLAQASTSFQHPNFQQVPAHYFTGLIHAL